MLERVDVGTQSVDRYRASFGERGHARVRERFLLPRLIADELRLYASVLGAQGSDSVGPSGSYGPHSDPVCGMRIDERTVGTSPSVGTTTTSAPRDASSSSRRHPTNSCARPEQDLATIADLV